MKHINFVLPVLMLLLLPLASADLECMVDSGDSSCPAGWTKVFAMESTSNSHAELPTETNYDNVVCCRDDNGVSTFGTDCDGSSDEVIRLFQDTNSHVTEPGVADAQYTEEVCLSVDSASVVCTFNDGSCPAGYECLASVNTNFNSHIGDCGTYSKKVCCKWRDCSDECNPLTYPKCNPAGLNGVAETCILGADDCWDLNTDACTGEHCCDPLGCQRCPCGDFDNFRQIQPFPIIPCIEPPPFEGDINDWACCSVFSNCVYEGTCYAHHTPIDTIGTPSSSDAVPGNDSYCEMGGWGDCDEGGAFGDDPTVCETICGYDVYGGFAFSGESFDHGDYTTSCNKKECCQDDWAEVYNWRLTNTFLPDSDGPPFVDDANDMACCNNFDCVLSTTCYPNGRGADSDSSNGNDSYCNSGDWYDCDDNFGGLFDGNQICGVRCGHGPGSFTKSGETVLHGEFQDLNLAECCGDDDDEYLKNKTCEGNSCVNDPNDLACCDASGDCLLSAECYSDGENTSIDDANDLSNDQEICASGVWTDQDENSAVCAGVWVSNDATCEIADRWDTDNGCNDVPGGNPNVYCCGDDPNEFLITGLDATQGCCNRDIDTVEGGICSSDCILSANETEVYSAVDWVVRLNANFVIDQVGDWTVVDCDNGSSSFQVQVTADNNFSVECVYPGYVGEINYTPNVSVGQSSCEILLERKVPDCDFSATLASYSYVPNSRDKASKVFPVNMTDTTEWAADSCPSWSGPVPYNLSILSETGTNYSALSDIEVLLDKNAVGQQVGTLTMSLADGELVARLNLSAKNTLTMEWMHGPLPPAEYLILLMLPGGSLCPACKELVDLPFLMTSGVYEEPETTDMDELLSRVGTRKQRLEDYCNEGCPQYCEHNLELANTYLDAANELSDYGQDLSRVRKYALEADNFAKRGLWYYCNYLELPEDKVTDCLGYSPGLV